MNLWYAISQSTCIKIRIEILTLVTKAFCLAALKMIWKKYHYVWKAIQQTPFNKVIAVHIQQFPQHHDRCFLYSYILWFLILWFPYSVVCLGCFVIPILPAWKPGSPGTWAIPLLGHCIHYNLTACSYHLTRWQHFWKPHIFESRSKVQAPELPQALSCSTTYTGYLWNILPPNLQCLEILRAWHWGAAHMSENTKQEQAGFSFTLLS